MATNDIGRVTPIWRGFFSAATTYELNDIVIDTAGSVWWHKSEEQTTGVIPEAGEIWDAVIDMSVFSALIQAAITTAQTAVQAAQEAESEVAEDVRRAETAAQSAEASAEAASESAAGVGALAQAAEQSKTEAQTAVTQAAASASSAGASATSAGSSAQTAEAAKTAAQTAATQAAGSAETASGAAAVVEQKKAEALAAIETKGEEVLESIPEDYTELSGDVGDLKTQLNTYSLEFVDGVNYANPYNPDYIPGAYIAKSGDKTDTPYYNVTGFIPVSEGEHIVYSTTVNGVVTTQRSRFTCAYDSTKSPLPLAGSDDEQWKYTVPEGVAYVRISIAASLWDGTLQIQKGFGRTDYVEPNKYYSPIKINDGAIYFNHLKNWKVTDGFNCAKSGINGNGAWYKSGDELVYAADSGTYAPYKYHIFPVEANTTYYFNNPSRFTASVDKNGDIINYSSSLRYSFDTGADAVLLILSYDAITYPGEMIAGTRGENKAEIRYTAKWLQSDFAERSIEGKAVNNRIYCSIPKNIYMNTTESIKIFIDNILAQNGSYFWCNSVSGLTTFINNEYLEITCGTAGTYVLSWAVYDSNLQAIDSGTVNVIVSALSNLQNKTGLIIGDSFTAYGQFSSHLRDDFDAQSKTLTLIGTQGTSPNFHEGRGGWSAQTYCNNASAGAYTNPFYNNGTFDFSYYMQNNSYSGVDIVIINLGINAIFSLDFETFKTNAENEITAYKKIIESIHAYNSSIEIYCDIPTPPNTVDGKFSTAYGTKQMLWMYANNIKHYARIMADEIGGNNVYIVGTNLVIDTNTDIEDGVHPKTSGYNAISTAIINTIIAS